ncbi:MAG: transcriptional repressor [Campylobacter sp.]|nr:transcriptional repressor [Campylobacter sp.]
MEFIELLNKYKLKATPQRLCVLEYLSRHTHPSIDELYEDIKRTYPSISLATVYKNLNTLIEKGIVVEVNAPNQKSRFDIVEEPHIHIVCKKCSHVMDLSSKDAKLEEFKAYLESQIGDFITDLNIVACVDECKFCK